MYTSYDEIALRLSGQFKIDADDYFVRTHSIQALKEMGLIQTNEELVYGPVKNQCLKLPKKYTRINWVIQSDPRPTTSVSMMLQNVWFPPQLFFTPIPNADTELLALIVNNDLKVNYIPQVKGPYIPFKWEDCCLHFNQTDMNVVVYAECLKLDSSNLPVILEEALEACMYYCAWVWYQPMVIIGKISPQVFGMIDTWVNKRFAQCQNQVGFKQLNSNEMSAVHSVMTSWDRKAYGVDS